MKVCLQTEDPFMVFNRNMAAVALMILLCTSFCVTMPTTGILVTENIKGFHSSYAFYSASPMTNYAALYFGLNCFTMKTNGIPIILYLSMMLCSVMRFYCADSCEQQHVVHNLAESEPSGA